MEKACQHVDLSVLISKQLEYETIDRRAIQAAKLFASSFVPLSAQDAFGLDFEDESLPTLERLDGRRAVVGSSRWDASL